MQEAFKVLSVWNSVKDLQSSEQVGDLALKAIGLFECEGCSSNYRQALAEFTNGVADLRRNSYT